MNLKGKTRKKYHPNGNLAYIETIAIVPDEKAYLFENRRIHPDGYVWIRIGKNAKYSQEGVVMWQLNYDKMGNLIKN